MRLMKQHEYEEKGVPPNLRLECRRCGQQVRPDGRDMDGLEPEYDCDKIVAPVGPVLPILLYN